jgi:uncharacterized protein
LTGLGFALAGLIGLSLGVLGGGGSILTVPVFVYAFGIAAKPAIAMSLGVVGATAALGAVSHWRAGNVDVRVAAMFGAVAMAGTYLGARASVFFSGTAQLVLFAVVMLGAAVMMLRRRPVETVAEVVPSPRRPGLRWLIISLEGLAVGALTGLVGVGGGFLIVPALVLLTGLPMRMAIGTSLVIIALKSAAGFIGYLGVVAVDWAFMGVFTAIAVAGIVIGSRAAGRIPQHRLQQAFGWFLVVTGAAMLIGNARF